MKIIVLHRIALEHGLIYVDEHGEQAPLPSHIIISITNPDRPQANIPADPACLGILRLSFWDVCNTEDPELSKIMFNAEHAQQISAFVHANLTKTPDLPLIICQCEAGRSRSAGVAAALSKLLTGEDEEYFKRYNPNSLVYSTIMNEAAELRKDPLPDCRPAPD